MTVVEKAPWVEKTIHIKKSICHIDTPLPYLGAVLICFNVEITITTATLNDVTAYSIDDNLLSFLRQLLTDDFDI